MTMTIGSLEEEICPDCVPESVSVEHDVLSSHEFGQKIRMKALHGAETLQSIAGMIEMPRCQAERKQYCS